MARTQGLRTYGRSTRTRARAALTELPQSPIRKPPTEESFIDEDDDSIIKQLVRQLENIDVADNSGESGSTVSEAITQTSHDEPEVAILDEENNAAKSPTTVDKPTKSSFVVELPVRPSEQPVEDAADVSIVQVPAEPEPSNDDLRVLSWHDVSPPGDTITKIAEASYAEVYRVKNARGTSIIKCIRLPSPIKAQTKAQVKSGLVDEEPHPQTDLLGELRISEWLADIPGFVVYKERYIVEGKAPKTLLETHQAFQRKMKRQDPDRLQFYPSPSRYLDGTRFLVVELGDAGTALEDFNLTTADQLWDIFFLVAVALARAEELIAFEVSHDGQLCTICILTCPKHRDLHEGNLCIRQVSKPRKRDPAVPGPSFGFSGLDITILDYGLSRAEEPLPFAGDDSYVSIPDPEVVALDLETDLSIFTSTHADQCKVYRQMRSFLLSNGTSRKCLPPSSHTIPYQTIKLPKALAAETPPEPISWAVSAPYTNVLWLAYIYEYIVDHFAGEKQHATRWRRDTAELWRHLDPGAKAGTPVFACAGDVVRFAVEAGWMTPEQITGGDCTRSFLAAEREHEDSIIQSLDIAEDENPTAADESQARGRVRRSGRKTAEPS